MTSKEWKDLELPMRWCIYNKDDYKALPKWDFSKGGTPGDENTVGQLPDNDEAKAYWTEFHTAFDNMRLNLEAPVPDGVYSVTKKKSEIEKNSPYPEFNTEEYVKKYNDAIPVVGGLVVEDGEFDPVTTAYVCYAVSRQFYESWAGYYKSIPWHGAINHMHIEGLEWNGESFELITGS